MPWPLRTGALCARQRPQHHGFLLIKPRLFSQWLRQGTAPARSHVAVACPLSSLSSFLNGSLVLADSRRLALLSATLRLDAAEKSARPAGAGRPSRRPSWSWSYWCLWNRVSRVCSMLCRLILGLEPFFAFPGWQRGHAAHASLCTKALRATAGTCSITAWSGA